METTDFNFMKAWGVVKDSHMQRSLLASPVGFADSVARVSAH